MPCRPAAPPARLPRAAFECLEARCHFSAYRVVDLGTLGGAQSWAYDLNNDDQVVGYATTPAGQDHAFLFSDANGNGLADAGEMQDLGALQGDSASYAYRISDAGQVAGSARSGPRAADGVERAARLP